MKVEIWSDVVCPWCAIGKRRFETALDGFEHKDDVEIVWRSFELDPTAPREATGSATQRLADKYGVPLEQAEAMNARVTEQAAGEGLAFRMDCTRPGNTVDAHRLLHLAKDRGVQHAVKERLLRAYFEQGEPISDPATLARLGAEAGLDETEAKEVLRGDRYLAEVRQDQAEARELGITGVPFFVIDRKYGVSGAQPAELFGQALRQAYAESTPLQLVHDHGDDCADGSCAVR
jgi:predicted DsbA family dithiol-disulfide isomerase